MTALMRRGHVRAPPLPPLFAPAFKPSRIADGPNYITSFGRVPQEL